MPWHHSWQRLFGYDLKSSDNKSKCKEDYIKLKSFYLAKETSVIKKPTGWKKIFKNHTSHKGLIAKIYRELKWLHSKKTNHLIKEMGKGPEQTFLKRRHISGLQTYEKVFNVTNQMQIKANEKKSLHAC
jgi:hypothetical protein